jgi:CRISPR/Cas system CMR subunit Cmr4 (Cas7 group RAMP superfamily)
MNKQVSISRLILTCSTVNLDLTDKYDYSSFKEFAVKEKNLNWIKFLTTDGKKFVNENNILYEDIPLLGELIMKDINLNFKDKLVFKRLAENQKKDKEILESFKLKLNSTIEKSVVTFIFEFDSLVIKEGYSGDVWKNVY